MLLCLAWEAFAENPPNVLIVLADDLGWKDVGYNGSEIRTPNIDALASQGVILTRYYAQPLCSPTRASLMTGQAALRTGVLRAIDKHNEQELPLDRNILPQYFKDVGYQTGRFDGSGLTTSFAKAPCPGRFP